MAEHIKPDGEPIALFAKRVLAWNGGEPVPPDPIPQKHLARKLLPPQQHRELMKKENPHKYARHGLYCTNASCYATKRDTRVLGTCPQFDPGCFVFTWKMFGYIDQTPWVD